MTDNNLLYQLALSMIPKIGAITAKKLVAYVGSSEAVFCEKKSSLRKIPGIGEFLANQVVLSKQLNKAESELKRMEKYNISAVYYRDEQYPWRLKQCDDAPLLLFYKGIPDFSRTRILSIVGTRSATRYGKQACESIISDLASKYPDLVIVSGLAYGIDIVAHRSAMENNLETFAVLAHGLHTIYPSVHADTAMKIMVNGGLLSDFHTAIEPERNNFLRRNRIIAGLSEATLVVESAIKGGALITAELASSYNRDVFAVPGRREDRYSSGCNFLIKSNLAALTETAEDIEKQLNWERPSGRKNNLRKISVPVTEDEQQIIKALRDSPGLGTEILSARTKIPVSRLSGLLLQMELRNWISVMPGNQYRASVDI